MNRIHYRYPLHKSREFVASQMGVDVAGLENQALYREQEDLSVDAIRELIAWCDISGTKFVLVPHAEQMQSEAANALLKTLEENDHVSFVFNAKHSLWPTIESRCKCEFLCVNRSEIISYIKEAYPYHLNIDPGADERAWEFSHDQDVIDDLFSGKGPMHIIKALDKDFDNLSRSPKELLKLLGLLEEKNSDNYFEKFSQYLEELLNFLIEKFFFSLAFDEKYENRVRAADKMKLLAEHAQICERSTYAKADFVQLMCNIAS